MDGKGAQEAINVANVNEAAHAICSQKGCKKPTGVKPRGGKKQYILAGERDALDKCGVERIIFSILC
jgi:hypothetical protein